MIPGVDISSHQGLGVDFAKMAQKIGYLYIRGAYAKNPDSQVVYHTIQAKQHALPYGLYYYVYPGAGRTWEAQAIACAAIEKQYGGAMPPALDLETSGNLTKAQLEAWVYKWLKRFCAELGIDLDYPLLYTRASFFNSSMPLTDWAWRMRLWLADYTPPAIAPDEWLNHNKSQTLWQTGIHKPATDYGVKPPPMGSHGIDIDRFDGDAAAFKHTFKCDPHLPIYTPPPVTNQVVTIGVVNPRTRPVLVADTDAGTILQGKIFDKAGSPQNGYQPVKVWLAESVIEDV